MKIVYHMGNLYRVRNSIVDEFQSLRDQHEALNLNDSDYNLKCAELADRWDELETEVVRRTPIGQVACNISEFLTLEMRV